MILILQDSIDSNNFELRRFSIASNTIAFVSAADLSFETQLNMTISTGTKNTTFAAMVNNNTWLYSANPTELDLLKTIVWRGLARN